MTILRKLLPVLLAVFPGLSLAGPTTHLGNSPTLAGGYYSTGGGLSIALDMRPHNGRTAFCGAWAESASLVGHLAGKSRALLATGSIYVDGVRVHHGLGFMARVAPAPSYAGAPARCVVTSRPWRAGDAARRPQVRIPSRLVVMDRNAGGGGLEIRFRQARGGNPAMSKGSLIPPEWKHMPSKQVGAGADHPGT